VAQVFELKRKSGEGCHSDTSRLSRETRRPPCS
jgi:hypothetical protein